MSKECLDLAIPASQKSKHGTLMKVYSYKLSFELNWIVYGAFMLPPPGAKRSFCSRVTFTRALPRAHIAMRNIRRLDSLFPVWRHDSVFTLWKSAELVIKYDITHLLLEPKDRFVHSLRSHVHYVGPMSQREISEDMTAYSLPEDMKAYSLHEKKQTL